MSHTMPKKMFFSIYLSIYLCVFSRKPFSCLLLLVLLLQWKYVYHQYYYYDSSCFPSALKPEKTRLFLPLIYKSWQDWANVLSKPSFSGLDKSSGEGILVFSVDESLTRMRRIPRVQIIRQSVKDHGHFALGKGKQSEQPEDYNHGFHIMVYQ